MPHGYFSSLTKSKYWSLFSFSLIFTLWLAGIAKSTIRQVLFFLLLTITRSGDEAKIRWSVCVLKSKRILLHFILHFDSVLCKYNQGERSNLNFLHYSQWIPFPTQLCLVLYSFCINLMHSLIMWLIISSLSP